MAFNLANIAFAPLASGPNEHLPLLWNYSTSDNVSTVDAEGYFDDAARVLRRGDVVRATANDGKAVYLAIAVTANPGGEEVVMVKIAVASSFPS